jgi:hypothetical protein
MACRLMAIIRPHLTSRRLGVLRVREARGMGFLFQPKSNSLYCRKHRITSPSCLNADSISVTIRKSGPKRIPRRLRSTDFQIDQF